MLRKFAKFYNEVKERPVPIPNELKKNLRNSTSAQIALRKTIKEFRAELPMLSLVDIAKASRAHIKAYFEIPDIITPNDPLFEPGLRKNLLQDVIDPLVRLQKDYLEDRLFVMDKSVEARRNYLLAQETDKAEKAIRENKEKLRIENLKSLDTKKYLTQSNVEGVLDGEINTQIVPFDEHTVLSFSGVVKMTSLPGKRARFVDLTHQELANYICYNLLSAEQALQMFVNSLENPNFHANTQAQLIQKLALLKVENTKDERLIQLITELNISELSKKNICNTL